MGGPRAEAAARLGAGYEVRVLEPSPPAVETDPYADDPVRAPEPAPGVQRVGPVEGGGFDLSWHDLAAKDESLAAWCADRWLGAWRPLGAAPAAFGATRQALHALAEHVFTPLREHAVDRIGLRWTRGGFGTPYLPGDVQARVEAGPDAVRLVLAGPDGDRHAAPHTLQAAAEFVGVPLGATGVHYPPLTPVVADAPLEFDAASARLLGDWFGFGTLVLEQVRVDTAGAGTPSRINLWPEHFDVAIDVGDEAAGGRASVGSSPGDAEHPEPYLYVAPWNRRGTTGYWNDAAFGGASLGLAELIGSGDGAAQRQRALDFIHEGLRSLS
jgi:hypothetical protein